MKEEISSSFKIERVNGRLKVIELDIEDVLNEEYGLPIIFGDKNDIEKVINKLYKKDNEEIQRDIERIYNLIYEDYEYIYLNVRRGNFEMATKHANDVTKLRGKLALLRYQKWKGDRK